MSLLNDKTIIYLITNGSADDSNFTETFPVILELIRTAVAEEISLIQIREKRLCGRLLCELTLDAAAITKGSKTKLLINDRADIALACGAHGVHLTTTSLPAAVIRASIPAGFIVGISTHTLAEAVDAERSGADFAVFGPVFATPDKGEAVGLSALAEVCEKLRPFPVIGLGGIDGANCDSVISAGASGTATIRSMSDARGIRLIAEKLRR
ncbi:thiamine phosphate synthase [soil metagenome]